MRFTQLSQYHQLVAKRDHWLNPPGLEGKELQKRTLTNLSNQRPTWLDLAHGSTELAEVKSSTPPSALPTAGRSI